MGGPENPPKKSFLEIVLMPLVLAFLGLATTLTIHFSEKQHRATTERIESRRLEEDSMRANERWVNEQDLQKQQREIDTHLKLLEIFGDKLFSKDVGERKLALQLVQNVWPDLAVTLTEAVFRSDPSPEVNTAARTALQSRLGLRAFASPDQVAPGEKTTITVIVTDRNGQAVGGASVKVSSGGGRFFSRPDEPYDPRARLHGPYEATGTSDANGRFTTWWAVNPAAAAYVMEVEATHEGHLPVRESLRIPVRAAPSTATAEFQTPRILSVSSSAEPSTVRPGQKTTIVVMVRDERGQPVPGASVEVAAGGGRFLGSANEAYDPNSRLHGPYAATGLTDAQGRFTTWWVVNPAAPGYGLGVTAKKDGCLDAKGSLDISVR